MGTSVRCDNCNGPAWQGSNEDFNEDKAYICDKCENAIFYITRTKILLFSMVMAAIFVYIIKIPYISFMMGGFTVAVNNLIWNKHKIGGKPCRMKDTN